MNVQFKIKLNIPFAFYDVTSKYREKVLLNPIQSLILIIVKCFKEKNKLEKVSDLIKSKLNINENFYDLFKEEFNKLIFSEVLINESEEKKYENILVGFLVINKKNDNFLNQGYFVGNKDSSINKHYIFVNNLLIKDNLVISEKKFKEFSKGDDIKYFIEINRKINEKYMDLLDAEASSMNTNDIYIKNELNYYNEEEYKNFENIKYLDMDVEFIIKNNQLHPTDYLSNEVLELYKKNIYYHLDEKISVAISCKYNFSIISNDNYQWIEETDIEEKSIIKINSKSYYWFKESMVELFLTQKDINIINFNKKIPFFTTCFLPLKESLWIEEIINFWIKNNDEVILQVLSCIDEETKKVFKNSIMKNNDLLIEKYDFFISHFDKFKTEFLKLEFKKIIDLFNDKSPNKNLLKKIIEYDSITEKQFAQSLHEVIIADEKIQIFIIKTYKLDYSIQQNYFIKFKGIEEKINELFLEYQRLVYITDLNIVKKFQIKLREFLKSTNNDIDYIFSDMQNKLNVMIINFENKNRQEINDDLTLTVKKIREYVEPICKKLFPDKSLSQGVLEISKEIKWEKMKEEWKFAQQFMHSESKENKNLYNNENLIRVKNFLLELEKRKLNDKLEE